MSQTRTVTAPSIATKGRPRRASSPTRRETTFGTTSPSNGSAPTVATTTAATAATMDMPSATTVRWFSPSPVETSSPRPATVKRSAAM